MNIGSVTSGFSSYTSGVQPSPLQDAQQAQQVQSTSGNPESGRSERTERTEETPRPVTNTQGQVTGSTISVTA